MKTIQLALTDNMPFNMTNITQFFSDALKIALPILMVFGFIGIIWAIFKKANDDKYSVPRMIEDIFFNIVMIGVVLYLMFYQNPLISMT